jgi:hypothetical protein
MNKTQAVGKADEAPLSPLSRPLEAAGLLPGRRMRQFWRTLVSGQGCPLIGLASGGRGAALRAVRLLDNSGALLADKTSAPTLARRKKVERQMAVT